MRILLLWPIFHPTPTAAAIRGEAFARYLAKRGNRVHVITPTKDSASQFIPFHYENFTVSRLRTYDTFSERHGFLASSILSPLSLLGMRNVIVAFQPDVIIASSPAPFLALEGFVSSRSLKTPFVYDMRDSWRQEESTHRGVLRNRMKRTIEHYLCRQADLVFCVSESLRRSTISDYRLPASKLRVVSNGAETLGEMRQPQDKEYDLVWLGYPAANRNIPELLRGIAAASREVPIKMLCLGWKDSPQEAELSRLIDELGIGENVELRAPVSHDMVWGELVKARLGVTSLADVAAMASAIGMKIYEYLAAGLPVACLSPFPESELRNFVEGNKIGFYSHDSEEFAEKLTSLLSNENEFSGLQINARNVSMKFNWKSIVYGAYDEHLVGLGGLKT
jgi:glycosyltransferase involved in cell wall biosynthesis